MSQKQYQILWNDNSYSEVEALEDLPENKDGWWKVSELFNSQPKGIMYINLRNVAAIKES